MIYGDSQKLGWEVVKALGLEDQKVTSVTLRWKALNVPTVMVEFLLVDDEHHELISVLKKYKLVELEQ